MRCRRKAANVSSVLVAVTFVVITTVACQSPAPNPAPNMESEVDPDAGQFEASGVDIGELDAEQLRHITGMAAHHLCSGMFVVGRDLIRDPETVIQMDVARFDHFQWSDDFAYELDPEAKTASVRAPGGQLRVAKYFGDQGCTLLIDGESDVRYRPTPVPRDLPDPASEPWPMGDVDAMAPAPDGVDVAKLSAALDWAMGEPQNTRALVVVRGGKIIGERFAEGFTKNTPQISWSQGKSITAALIGVLVERGHFAIEDQAPVKEWHQQGDPRNALTFRHLLNMSSGLDFNNFGITAHNSWKTENEHFQIYFDAINVFEHAINQPLDIEPNSQFRYRNSDPLTLGRIVRQTVEAAGEDYLTFPQRALFDRIGARNFVLETDPFGNFIMTGYDYGSALDWARFGLLHLWDGEWLGQRILPQGWSKFVATPAPADPTKGYGGLFWLNRGGALDRVPADAYWASGFMGQTTMIIPSHDMVVVRLGPSPGGYNDYLNEMVGKILESITE